MFDSRCAHSVPAPNVSHSVSHWLQKQRPTPTLGALLTRAVLLAILVWLFPAAWMLATVGGEALRRVMAP